MEKHTLTFVKRQHAGRKMIRKPRTQKELEVAIKAVRSMGGPAKAARLITYVTGESIDKVSVFGWTKRGIPPGWADEVYSICGVPPWISNPGVFHKRLEKANYLPIKSLTLRAQRFIDNGYQAGK